MKSWKREFHNNNNSNDKKIYIFKRAIVIVQLDVTHKKEEFEDTKGVIRICKWKKDRQHNGQKKEKRQNYKQLSTKHYT